MRAISDCNFEPCLSEEDDIRADITLLRTSTQLQYSGTLPKKVGHPCFKWSWSRAHGQRSRLEGSKHRAIEVPPCRESDAHKICRDLMTLTNLTCIRPSTWRVFSGARLNLMTWLREPSGQGRTRSRNITNSILEPMKTRCVGKRCMLNLSKTQTSCRWCGS
ncbi:hypothetical protein TNCV_4864811 [Trichonephila clavipes]|nr:hypothetical protein TNCV_4864811 [Trichonephila clavipes]